MELFAFWPRIERDVEPAEHLDERVAPVRVPPSHDPVRGAAARDLDVLLGGEELEARERALDEAGEDERLRRPRRLRIERLAVSSARRILELLQTLGQRVMTTFFSV